MKFGKTLAKRQLDIPEYGASFVNYKALKKLIKSLGAQVRSAPVLSDPAAHAGAIGGPQTTLQEHKATFFFRLERELEKVNAFYLQKEAESKLRLKTLIDKKKVIQSRIETTSKISASYVTLREGFQQFEHDLSKLQQFVEINATAFSKILKKWDKSSKSRTKELYISRAVEVQPCFNREVITELSDQATTSLMELEAWAEGENISFSQNITDSASGSHILGIDDSETDAEILRALLSDNTTVVKEWVVRLSGSDKAPERVTKLFLAAIPEGPEGALGVLVETGLIDFRAEDEINERNCLHEATISDRPQILRIGLERGISVKRQDVYGRIPLHYAAMHGRLEIMQALIAIDPSTIDYMDHDNFTPLIHAITHNQRGCVSALIASNARVNPRHEQDHIPLNLACQHGFEEISEILLQNQARILPDAEGLFPQHLVARSGHSVRLLMLLQQYGADVNEADKLFQWTPIFHAASEGHVDCVRALLQSGARADVLDEKRLSAMYYAAWEGHLGCMRLLAAAGGGLGVAGTVALGPSPTSVASTQSGQMTADSDGIPDLFLPPPILPLRRYGHNFLENKTLVQLSFEEIGSDPIHFDQDSKFPSARLTISSKSSELIPRNFLLPLNEEAKAVSFQIDTLETFSIDFDIYPTFGSKMLARTIALSDTFNGSRSGHCVLPLFDPRLRATARLSFNFQIIKPFQGKPLEITHFATYWKSTGQLDTHSNMLITDSSLYGDYIRLPIQLTSDLVPVLHPGPAVLFDGLEISICYLTYAQFCQLGGQRPEDEMQEKLVTLQTLAHVHEFLAKSFMSLQDVLSILPPQTHLDLNIMRPRVGATGEAPDLNSVVDTVLATVFDHARALKASAELTRSIVFSSADTDVCTALNWKQPNYPVFYCSNLDNESNLEPGCLAAENRPSSMKEAVRFASGNNLMGLICSSSLLEMVPALVQSVKEAGLVLVARVSHEGALLTPGIEGTLQPDGILRFEKTIDM